MRKPREIEWVETKIETDELLAKCRDMLARRGWRVLDDCKGAARCAPTGEDRDGWSVVGEKGRAGFWGSVVFHIGMLVVLVGVWVSLLGAFHAVILISEGQTVNLKERGSYLNIIKESSLIRALPEGKITLDVFHADYNDAGEPTGFALDMRLEGTDHETYKSRIEVNRPIEVGGLKMSFRKYGFAPRFTVESPVGNKILDASVRLNVFGPDELDAFTAPTDPPEEIRLRFFPDLYEERDRIGSRSIAPRNPAFLLSMGDSDKSALLRKGETVYLDGLNIRFVDLHYWAYLEADRDPAMGIMFAGFVLVAGGLIWRFWFHERRVVLRVEGARPARVAFWGKSSYFPALFEEEINKYRMELLDIVGARRAVPLRGDK